MAKDFGHYVFRVQVLVQSVDVVDGCDRIFATVVLDYKGGFESSKYVRHANNNYVVLTVTPSPQALQFGAGYSWLILGEFSLFLLAFCLLKPL